jgi:hypothetical protein
MRWRILLVAIPGLILLLAPAAPAQDAPPAAPAAPAQPQDDRDYAQQMRDVMRDVMRNMADKGIDPQEFMANIREQMADGSFDIAQTQKELIAEGVMDEEMVETMRSSAQKLVAGTLKQRLGVTDEEWAVIVPKLGRVMTALADSGEGRNVIGGRMGGALLMGGSAGAGGAANKALGELRAALKDKQTPEAAIAEKLQELRDVREKAKEELAAARKDLASVLTARQEAILAGLGYL